LADLLNIAFFVNSSSSHPPKEILGGFEVLYQTPIGENKDTQQVERADT
jgi:hypothetical protein